MHLQTISIHTSFCHCTYANTMMLIQPTKCRHILYVHRYSMHIPCERFHPHSFIIFFLRSTHPCTRPNSNLYSSSCYCRPAPRLLLEVLSGLSSIVVKKNGTLSSQSHKNTCRTPSLFLSRLFL